MSDHYVSPGRTTIAPDVLITIAQLTTLAVEGVSRMTPAPSTVSRLFQKGMESGVHIHVEETTVSADLYVILKSGYNIRDVSRNIQAEVARAISEMVGMSVGHINIHVEEIDYPDGD